MAYPSKAGDWKMSTRAKQRLNLIRETRIKDKCKTRSSAPSQSQEEDVGAVNGDDNELRKGASEKKLVVHVDNQANSDTIVGQSPATVEQTAVTVPRKRGRPPKSLTNLQGQTICQDIDSSGNLKSPINADDANAKEVCDMKKPRIGSQSGLDTESENCSQEESTLDKMASSTTAGDSCANIFTTESEMDCISSDDLGSLTANVVLKRKRSGRGRKPDVIRSPATLESEQVQQFPQQEFLHEGEATPQIESPITRKRGRLKKSALTSMSSQSEDSAVCISSPEPVIPVRSFWCVKSPPKPEPSNLSATITRKRGRPPKSSRNPDYLSSDAAASDSQNSPAATGAIMVDKPLQNEEFLELNRRNEGERTLFSPVTRKRGRPSKLSHSSQSGQSLSEASEVLSLGERKSDGYISSDLETCEMNRKQLDKRETTVPGSQPTKPFWPLKSPEASQLSIGSPATPALSHPSNSLRKRGRPAKSPRNVENSVLHTPVSLARLFIHSDIKVVDLMESSTSEIKMDSKGDNQDIGASFLSTDSKINCPSSEDATSPFVNAKCRKPGRPRKHNVFTSPVPASDEQSKPFSGEKCHAQGETTLTCSERSRRFQPVNSSPIVHSEQISDEIDIDIRQETRIAPDNDAMDSAKKNSKKTELREDISHTAMNASEQNICVTMVTEGENDGLESGKKGEIVSEVAKKRRGRPKKVLSDSKMMGSNSDSMDIDTQGETTLASPKLHNSADDRSENKVGKPELRIPRLSTRCSEQIVNVNATELDVINHEEMAGERSAKGEIPEGMTSIPTVDSEIECPSSEDMTSPFVNAKLKKRGRPRKHNVFMSPPSASDEQSYLCSGEKSLPSEEIIRSSPDSGQKFQSNHCVQEGDADDLESEGKNEVAKKKRGRPKKVQCENQTKGSNSDSMSVDNLGETSFESPKQSISADLSESSTGQKKSRTRRRTRYLGTDQSVTKLSLTDKEKTTDRVSAAKISDVISVEITSDVPLSDAEKHVIGSKRKSGGHQNILQKACVAVIKTSDIKRVISGAVTSTPKPDKKHRGRPPKSKETPITKGEGHSISQEQEQDSSFDSIIFNSTPERRKRGRPRKSDSALSPVVSPRGRGRGRGRPPFVKKGRGQPASRGVTPIQQYAISLSTRRGSIGKSSSQDRGRGRQSKQRRSFGGSDIDASLDTSRRESKSRGSCKKKGRPPRLALSDQSSIEDELRDYQCLKCDEKFTGQSKIQYHMMYSHQALWTPQAPEGRTDSLAIRAIYKRVKKLHCPTCSKSHNCLTGYLHHMEWCGRETEMYTCELCGHLLKAMWRKVHMRDHRNKERKAEELRVKAEVDAHLDEGGEAELTQSGHVKRQSAKRALLHLKDVQEQFTFDDGPKKKRRKKEASDDEASVWESSDDDAIDNDDQVDFDVQEVKTPRKTQGQFQPGHRPQVTTHIDKVFEKHWQWHKEFWEKPGFAKIYPQKSDCTWLQNTEADLYLPSSKESARIAITDDNNDNTDIPNAAPFQLFDHSYSESGCATFFVGGPVWAMSWCPTPPTNHRQYAAISCHMTMEEKHGVSDPYSGPGLVQIWDFGYLSVDSESMEPVLALGLAHDHGRVYDMSWCPGAGTNREPAESDNVKSCECVSSIGLLALACSEGMVVIYSIPEPSELEQREEGLSYPIMKLRPAFTLQPNFQNSSNRSGCCMCVDWSPHGEQSLILAGYGTGYICIWNLKNKSPLLKANTGSDKVELFPFHSFVASTLKIGRCKWSPFSSDYFLTGGLDRSLNVWDVRDTSRPVVGERFSVVTSVNWLRPWKMPFCSLDDSFQVCQSGILGLNIFGEDVNILRPSFAHGDIGCVWDVDISPWLNSMVFCNNTGCVIGLHLEPHIQYLKKRTKGLKKRFFLYKADLIPNSNTPSNQTKQPSGGEKRKINSKTCRSSNNTAVAKGQQFCESSVVCRDDNVDSVTRDKNDVADDGQSLQGGTSGSPEHLEINQRESDHSYAQMNGSRSTYAEVKDKFCMVYRDNHTLQKAGEIFCDDKLKNFRTFHGQTAEDHQMFPLPAVYRVCFSPNAVSCSWVLTAGQAGIVKLQNLSNLIHADGRKILHSAHLL